MLIRPNSLLRNKWAAATVLALILLGLATCGYVRERSHRMQYGVELDTALLESVGLKQALESKPREVIKLVEKKIPVEVTKLIEQRVLVPVASGVIEGAPQSVEIPLVDLQPGLEQPQAVPVDVSLSGWFLLTRAPGGSIGYDGAFTAKLSSGEWSRAVPFDKTNTTIDLRVSEDITESLRAHEAETRITATVRPVSQWRLGWQAGIGLSVDPFTGRAAPAVYMGYGVQF